MIHIPVKRVRPDAVLPRRQHTYDAGWDLTVCMASRGSSGSESARRVTSSMYTGLAMAIPPGYWGMLAARSSIYMKGIYLANGIGVIDSSYRGELIVNFYGDSPYDPGDRCCQFLLMPVLTTEYDFVEVDELPPSPDGRGEGGFGSTGK